MRAANDKKKQPVSISPDAGLLAERAVLGGVLLENDAVYRCSALRPDDFKLDSHRRIFRAMYDLAMAGVAIDTVTLVDEIQKHVRIEAIGGMAYLSELLDAIPDSNPSLDRYVAMVGDASRRRRFRLLGGQNGPSAHLG